VPWLPVGPAHKALAVSEQEGDPDSMLSYARRFLAARHQHAPLRLGDIAFVDAETPVLAFTRSYERQTILCVFNMSGQEARFGHLDVTSRHMLDFGCGSVSMNGASLELGGFAACFLGQ
jgi:glycosidase